VWYEHPYEHARQSRDNYCCCAAVIIVHRVSSSHVIFLASALARSRVYSLSLPEPNTTSFSSPLTGYEPSPAPVVAVLKLFT
jgi:hypothetical protein